MKRFLALLLAIPLLAAADVVVAERLNYRIMLPEGASAVQQTAAAELQRYLAKIFQEPVRCNGETPELLTFMVGFPVEAVRAGFTGLPALSDYPGEFALFTRRQAILFSGQDDSDVDPWALTGKTGTLLSVYYFLEKYAGMTFFAPGAKGEHLTPNPELLLPAQDLPQPAFAVRGFTVNNTTLPREDLLRFFKQRLCSVPGWAVPDLNYQTLNRWNKRFAERPELFALCGGRRVNQNYPWHVPCLSQPEVFTIIASDILAEIARRGNVRTVRIFGSDAPIQPCECSDCQKFANGSDYVYTFINRIAATIRQSHPDMNFYTQEKGKSYGWPPTGVSLEPGFTVAIETGYPYLKEYRHNLPLFDAWRQAGARTLIRGYPRLPEMKDYLICNQGEIVRMLRLMQGNANGMLISDGGRHRLEIHYACALLANSIQARALFNPDLDLDREVLRFCQLAYPGAGAEMAAFYAAMQHIRGQHSDRVNPLTGPYAAPNLDHPAALLETARQKVTDPFWLQPVYDNFQKLRQDAEPLRPCIARHAALMADYPKLPSTLAIPRHSPASTGITLPLFPRLPYVTDFQGAEVSFSADAQTLHVTLTAREADLNALKADFSPEQKTRSVFSDDCFEIMFAHAADDRPFLQIAVNPRGHVLTLEHHPDGYRHATLPGLRVTPDPAAASGTWSIRLAIPRHSLQPYCPGNQGRLAVFRSRPASGSREAQISGIPAEGYTNLNLEDYKPFTLPRRSPFCWLRRP